MRRLLLALLVVLLFPASASGAIRAAFYYPWFPETWTVNGSHVFYNPTLGYYSSNDQAVVDQHVKWLGNTGFNAGIASWWGQGQHNEQSRIPLILNRTQALRPKLKWAALYEKEGFGNPTLTELQSDIAYLGTYANHPQWLRINSKPVLFVYNADDTTCSVVDKWKQAAPGWYLVMKVFSGYASCPNQPDSWHQYGPTSATHSHPPHSYVISPGFWRADEASPRLARDLNRWKQNAVACANTTNTWCLVTTFNEWGEGTAVEPATEWIDACGAPCSAGHYLHALWKAFTNQPPPPPPPSGDSVIAAAGDIANPCSAGSPPSGAQATSNLLTGATFVLGLGDLQYESGALTAFQNCYGPTWGRFNSVAKPAPGNHEYQTSGASGYFAYFNGIQPYYAFDCGTWRCYALNSQVAMASGSAQNNWLRADLASNPKVCTLAFWHYPRYSSGNYAPGISSVQALLDALSGVDVVLNGHDHLYERFALRNGYRQFTVGTGGRSHYSFSTIQPGSEVRNSTTFGVLKVTLRASDYSWQFVPIAGQTFTDSGSDVCR